MKIVHKIIQVGLTAIIGVVLASAVAYADSAYGDYSLIATPGENESYYGQCSVVSGPTNVYGIANVYSYWKINNTWQLYSVPAGSMAVRVSLLKDHSLLATSATWGTNTTSDYRAYQTLKRTGTYGSIYTSTGEAWVYGSSTSSWYYHTISESRAVSFPPSRTSDANQVTSEYPACGFLENGQSFGYMGMVGVEDGVPDWISAYATNGERGYIKAADFQLPMPTDPADAVVNFATLRVKTIPVYESPTSDVIVGHYDMYYGGTEEVLDLTDGSIDCGN